MSQHYTRNTVSAQAPCSKCGKNTPHRIDDRRIGPCLLCIDRLEEKHRTILLPSNATPAEREAFEERAAIKEYCGNVPREQAEKEAFSEVFLAPLQKSASQGGLW